MSYNYCKLKLKDCKLKKGKTQKQLASLSEKLESRRQEAVANEKFLYEQITKAITDIASYEEDIEGYHSTIETLEKESKALSDEIAQVKMKN